MIYKKIIKIYLDDFEVQDVNILRNIKYTCQISCGI